MTNTRIYRRWYRFAHSLTCDLMLAGACLAAMFLICLAAGCQV